MTWCKAPEWNQFSTYVFLRSRCCCIYLWERTGRRDKNFFKKHGIILGSQVRPLGGDLFKKKLGAERLTALLLLRTKTLTNKQKKQQVTTCLPRCTGLILNLNASSQKLKFIIFNKLNSFFFLNTPFNNKSIYRLIIFNNLRVMCSFSLKSSITHPGSAPYISRVITRPSAFFFFLRAFYFSFEATLPKSSSPGWHVCCGAHHELPHRDRSSTQSPECMLLERRESCLIKKKKKHNGGVWCGSVCLKL